MWKFVRIFLSVRSKFRKEINSKRKKPYEKFVSSVLQKPYDRQNLTNFLMISLYVLLRQLLGKKMDFSINTPAKAVPCVSKNLLKDRWGSLSLGPCRDPVGPGVQRHLLSPFLFLVFLSSWVLYRVNDASVFFCLVVFPTPWKIGLTVSFLFRKIF